MIYKKEYLGDGVYVANTGYSIILTTENGERVGNTIHLDAADIGELIKFIKEAGFIKEPL
jgi:hypothetical protein